MDSIVTTAIVGTGQAGNQGITTHTPVDTLAAQLSCEPERQLLLTAGAWAIYRKAGSMPASAPAAPSPAEPESLAVCSPKAAHIVNTLLVGEYRELALEALTRMYHARLRLPHTLLTLALEYGTQTKEARATLVPLLGFRGRWLSQFNPAWSWVTHYLAETTQTVPDDAETIWQEGTQGQRSEILRRLRQIDPARAREWLVTVWKQEKAETRNAFLATFEVNLSQEDEPLLEQALDDRSSNVHSTAASLLSHLPGSALVQRMQVRADTMLSYTGNELIVALPEEIDREWMRDGISGETYNSKGKRTSWMMEVLAQVPPQHWEARFGVPPQQLIKAAANTEWSQEITESWSNAALRHNSTTWIAPLLDWWYDSQPDSQRRRTPAKIQGASLLPLLPQKEAEQKVLQLRESGKEWQPALMALPQPWSKEFGDTCLRILRDYLGAMNEQTPYDYEWIQFLKTTVTALPYSCFASALQPWELPPETTSWMISHWEKELSRFEAQIDMRKRILEEIK